MGLVLLGAALLLVEALVLAGIAEARRNASAWLARPEGEEGGERS